MWSEAQSKDEYHYQTIIPTTPLPDAKTSTPRRPAAAWMPIYFQTWFITLLVVLMLVIAIGLEVALWFSQKNSGWPTKATNSRSEALHLVYVIIPEAIALMIVAVWSSTNLEIKKMQPFVDLAQGNARCETTLLLDYTSANNFLLCLSAIANRHYVVFISTVAVILGLALQTLAASVFFVQDVYLLNPNFSSTTSVATMGLSPNYATLVPFVAAAGYAEAAVVFNVTRPEFVSDTWTVAMFEIPTNVGSGTISLNTTAIKSEGNCIPADTVAITGSPSTFFTMNATYNGCEWDWNVTTTSTTQFGLDILTDCSFTDSTPDQFKPPIFWIFDASDEKNPKASVSFCRPNLTLANVAVTADIQTSKLDVQMRTDAPFSGGGNLTGPGPLNGRAFNGVDFNFTTNPDPFIQNRITALKTILPSAMFQSSTQLSNGTNNVFSDNGTTWASVVGNVYTTYLTLMASSVYFVQDNSTLPMVTHNNQSRLLINQIAVHLLVGLLTLIAILGFIGHFLQKKQLREVNLRQSPGTIAAAAAIISDTDVGRELDPSHTSADIIATFSDKRLARDKITGKAILKRS